MAEQLIKNPVCSKCGLEARPNAAFCFSCGGEIIESNSSQQSPLSNRDNGISSAWFRSDITAAESQKLPPLKVEEAFAEPTEAKPEEKGKSGKLKSKFKNNVKKTGPLASDATTPLISEVEEPKVSLLNKDAAINKKPEEITVSTSEQPTENKLKSAASIRQKSKLAEKKKVEFVWVPPQGAPNVWFVAVSIILTLFAIGVFVVMRYIR